MKLRPIDDRIVIEVQSAKEKIVGGIIIPATAEEKEQIGVVIAVGTDEELQKILKAGDKILFNSFRSKEANIEGKAYTFISREDVLAVVE
ncbi:MAG: co-chaperone GroES [Candidatus Cloacimonas sp.]|nr:co-chaperone GroES [Candidatus Cloacimonadota bacterium]